MWRRAGHASRVSSISGSGFTIPCPTHHNATCPVMLLNRVVRRAGLARAIAWCGPQASREKHMSLDLREGMALPSTWDRFYAEKRAGDFRHFDWFFGYSAVSEQLVPFVRGGARDGACHVLDVGCGTSDFGASLYRASRLPVHVSCVDFSPVAVELMERQWRERPPAPGHPSSTLRFMLADAARLGGLPGFEDGAFGLVLDKGTVDAAIRANDGGRAARRLLAEGLRLLRPGCGALLQFSDEDPDARCPWLEEAAAVAGGGPGRVAVTARELGEFRGVAYYMYVLRKQEVDDDEDDDDDDDDKKKD
uniref:Citrate synthase-lysine N-methyltransferase CSKMT, mitochondrial n=2 Tax=Petromyzon marinus TaxID=7757 RepID=A0AAJ7TNE7_PETMA|nr:citrate synthase-lysine N-methyltransferase CSKMT, mitochondrial isoform X2 [Petromyzon marinus]